MKVKIFCLALASLFLVGGWAAPALAEEDSAAEAQEQDLSQNASDNEDGALMTPAAPLELNFEAPLVFVAGCTTTACGNTGTTYGYGASCAAAKSNLASQISAASYQICPGIVTGVDIHYGSCSGGGGIAECKFSGNADIECKICPGQSCHGGA